MRAHVKYRHGLFLVASVAMAASWLWGLAWAWQHWGALGAAVTMVSVVGMVLAPFLMGFTSGVWWAALLEVASMAASAAGNYLRATAENERAFRRKVNARFGRKRTRISVQANARFDGS